MRKLAVNDLLPDLRYATRAKRIGLTRPAERRLRLLPGLQQRLLRPLRREGRVLIDGIGFVEDLPSRIGGYVRAFSAYLMGLCIGDCESFSVFLGLTAVLGKPSKSEHFRRYHTKYTVHPWRGLEFVAQSQFRRVVRRNSGVNGCHSYHGFSCFFWERRYSRRISAAAYRRFSSSVSGRTGGTGTPSLLGPSATNVRYAEDVCRRTPVPRSSTHTLTPTSIDVRNARLTADFKIINCPM